jgi:LysM repeat protein
MRLHLLAVLLLILCACGDGRWAPGYLITADGETLSNTDENYRAMTVDTIVSELDAQLGKHWRVEATISELPRYEGSDDGRNTGWMWAKATASITLLGDGMGEPPLSEAQITKAVNDYLYNKVEKAHRNLNITTTRVVDAGRFAAKPAPATKTAAKSNETIEKPVVPSAPATGRYVVQAGDTWAELSQAFYGSSQHWRYLSDANQGGDLNVGRTIVIPQKP